MTKSVRSNLVLVVFLSAFVAGCGCEIFAVRATAQGVGYQVDRPGETIELSLAWEESPFQEALLDAMTTEGTVASICLSAEPDRSQDLVLRLDYGLKVGATQVGRRPDNSYLCMQVDQEVVPDDLGSVFGNNLLVNLHAEV